MRRSEPAIRGKQQARPRRRRLQTSGNRRRRRSLQSYPLRMSIELPVVGDLVGFESLKLNSGRLLGAHSSRRPRIQQGLRVADAAVVPLALLIVPRGRASAVSNAIDPMLLKTSEVALCGAAFALLVLTYRLITYRR